VEGLASPDRPRTFLATFYGAFAAGPCPGGPLALDYAPQSGSPCCSWVGPGPENGVLAPARSSGIRAAADQHRKSGGGAESIRLAEDDVVDQPWQVMTRRRCVAIVLDVGKNCGKSQIRGELPPNWNRGIEDKTRKWFQVFFMCPRFSNFGNFPGLVPSRCSNLCSRPGAALGRAQRLRTRGT